MQLLSENSYGYFFDNISTKWATFYSNMLSHCTYGLQRLLSST